MLLEISTAGKSVLIVVAGLFIAWAFVTAIMVPRRNPGFPRNLSAYITLSAVLFVAQLGAVYWVVTYQEVEKEAIEEPAPSETGPTETTDTATTETEPAETIDTATTATEPTDTGPSETETTGSTEGDPTAGKEVFASAGCGSCHTLAAAGASGSVGPNLDDAKPSFELAVDRVQNGKGVMPSFQGQLDEQQIRDVAAYVSSATGS